MPSDRKQQWKLQKAKIMDGYRIKDKFLDLLRILDLITEQTWTDAFCAVESDKQYAASMRYEAYDELE